MKAPLLLALSIITTSACFAQAEKNDLSVAVDFKAISRLGRMQTSDAFQSYKSESVTGSQFYNTSWCTGTITTATNEEIENYLLLYDKVRQELFIRPKDTNMIIQADKSQVKSFTLNMDKPHVFVQAASYDHLLSNSFFEILVPSTNYALFKLTKTSFEKADYNDMLKVKNGEVADAFVDNISYYVFHNNVLTKTALKERAVEKTITGQADKINAFFNQHQNEEFNEAMLMQLIITLNG
jgi:hypothetical protein